MAGILIIYHSLMRPVKEKY